MPPKPTRPSVLPRDLAAIATMPPAATRPQPPRRCLPGTAQQQHRAADHVLGDRQRVGAGRRKDRDAAGFAGRRGRCCRARRRADRPPAAAAPAAPARRRPACDCARSARAPRPPRQERGPVIDQFRRVIDVEALPQRLDRRLVHELRNHDPHETRPDDAPPPAPVNPGRDSSTDPISDPCSPRSRATCRMNRRPRQAAAAHETNAAPTQLAAADPAPPGRRRCPQWGSGRRPLRGRPHYADSWSRVSTNSRWPSASAAVSGRWPCAACIRAVCRRPGRD